MMQQAMKATYTPGLHIICDIQSHDSSSMENAEAFRVWVVAQIEKHQLCSLGEVVHQFPASGFTAVVCLTDSHISVHTWPEYGRVTFDVFLSNYNGVNDAKTRNIADDLCLFFKAESEQRTELKR
ncbi:MAG: S-adenosylmethionine decarboxylase [Chitinophagales bacterium]|jgi:S-adenosylmethionine decarboxylase